VWQGAAVLLERAGGYKFGLALAPHGSLRTGDLLRPRAAVVGLAGRIARRACPSRRVDPVPRASTSGICQENCHVISRHSNVGGKTGTPSPRSSPCSRLRHATYGSRLIGTHLRTRRGRMVAPVRVTAQRPLRFASLALRGRAHGPKRMLRLPTKPAPRRNQTRI